MQAGYNTATLLAQQRDLKLMMSWQLCKL
jgi:hypothetical protein